MLSSRSSILSPRLFILVLIASALCIYLQLLTITQLVSIMSPQNFFMPVSPIMHIFIHLSHSDPSKHEVFTLERGKKLPNPKIQEIWDNEQKRQEGTDIGDGPAYAMQPLPENYEKYTEILLTIEYPESNYRYHYTDSQRGISQWYFEFTSTPGKGNSNGVPLTLFRHRFFMDSLALLDPKVHSSNVALLEACRPLPCACSHCNRALVGENFVATIYLNNHGIDANQELDEYMTVVMCGHLRLVEFLNAVYNGNPKHKEDPGEVYFRSIIEIPNNSSKRSFTYGKTYSYEDVSPEKPILVSDLEWFSGGKKHVALAAVIGGCYE